MGTEGFDKRSDSPGRLWVTAFILGFLVLQIGLPVSYYLDDDPFDERFAWRMFSSIRMTDCQLDAHRIDDSGRSRRILVRRDIQLAWANLLERNRDAVVRAYLKRQCRREGPAEVELRTHCVGPGGERSRHAWQTRCESGEIEREDEWLEE